MAWSGPGGSVKVSHISRSTGRWTSPAEVSPAGVGAEVLDVEVDHAGRAIVVWIESDRRAHGARSAAAAARWTQPAAISPVGLTARYAQAGVDPSGNAIVVWGAAVQGCPPQCGGSIQGTRWLGSPAAPAVTTVAAAAAALTIGFVPPLSLDAGFDPTNYEYSTDDGASWTTRDPASTASPLVIRGLTAGTLYRSRLRAVNHAGIGEAL